MRTRKEWEELKNKEEQALVEKHGKEILKEIDTYILTYMGGILSTLHHGKMPVGFALKIIDETTTKAQEEAKQ